MSSSTSQNDENAGSDDERVDTPRARRVGEEMIVLMALGGATFAALGLSIWVSQEIDSTLAGVIYVVLLAAGVFALFVWRHRRTDHDWRHWILPSVVVAILTVSSVLSWLLDWLGPSGLLAVHVVGLTLAAFVAKWSHAGGKA